MDDENIDIENETNVTVIFPDSSLPQSSRGGFKNQDEFRQFVTKNQDGSWDSQLHARPTAERLFDHNGETLAKAFPLLFPYGYSGFAEDPSVKILSRNRTKTQMKRDLTSVIRKYLLHRKPECHMPTFVLVVNNVLMKQEIFESARIMCNCRKSDSVAMGEKFGAMKSPEFEKAIQDNRNQSTSRFSTKPANSFLASITASCKALAHTNEASMEARKVYFSYLTRFGLPCVFLTVTPDDNRNYRIALFNMEHTEYKFGVLNPNDVTEEKLLLDFEFRRKIRTDLPGLCAEEYRRIMNIVVEKIFQWDTKEQRSKGIGLFGELQAWTIATEEQGRKTLHGHMLLFVKDWNTVLARLHRKQKECATFAVTVRSSVNFYKWISSATLFSDFVPVHGSMSQQSVFHHKCSRSPRNAQAMRYTCKEVPEQTLREMRHKQLCHHHNGHIATCPKCERDFRINDVVSTALNCHLGEGSLLYGFPDSKKRLDQYVYNLQKNRNWTKESDYTRALRYFSANALVNVHLPCHATRCFKKGSECYANLPDVATENTLLTFEEEHDLWADCFANRERRFMFRFYPQRSIADVFMNTHNTILTQLLLTNTNVMFGMNGASVFYVTGYNIKAQQKEENFAFERVSNMLMRTLQKQEEESDIEENVLSDYQKGFRRMLGGIYSHTGAHIIAAPMAHYLALEGSRFRYSHHHTYLPVHSLENMLSDNPVMMKFHSHNGSQIPFNSAMEYLNRPENMEQMCAYQFYEQTETISLSLAKKLQKPYFALKAGHPLACKMVVVFRDKHTIPVFQWNWLQSCLEFRKPLFDAAQIPVCADRERYCKRFMILFCPFRDSEEMTDVNGSHEDTLNKRINDNMIHEDMISIANNIQNIHNSLHSKMPANMLTVMTDEADIETFDMESDEPGIDFEALQINIGNFMASSSTHTVLKQESTHFDPNCNAPFKKSHQTQNQPLCNPESIFVYQDENESRKKNSKKQNPDPRYYTTTSQINSLFQQQFVSFTRNDPETENAPRRKTVKATGSWESIVAWEQSKGLDDEQQIAFEIMTATYVLTFVEEADPDVEPNGLTISQKDILKRFARRNPNRTTPLRLFVTGPAGAGKSKLLEEVILYCRSYSQNIGHIFTENTIHVSAMTGAAATEIGGDTSAREFGLRQKREEANSHDINRFRDAQLNIVDEVSFADYDMDMGKLSNNLQNFTETRDWQYGKTAIVFLGDFCQLEPIGENCIYKHPNGIYWEQALTNLVELKGTHRYSECQHMQRIMPMLRDTGILSDADRKLINSRLVNGTSLPLPNLQTTRFASFYNQKRAETNTAVFHDYLAKYHAGYDENSVPDSAIIIKSTTRWGQTKTNLSWDHRKILFENCTDAHVTDGNSKRADPFLCLFSGSHVMGTRNEDVKNGIANGTTATFEKVVLKRGKHPTPAKVGGFWVQTIDIEDVELLTLKWQDCRFRGTFNIKPTKHTYTVKFPVEEFGERIRMKCSMELTCFDIISNHCTTGHKLQGKSLDQLVVTEWSKRRNWAYVVLSRVRTLKGLFLLKRLPVDIDFAPNTDYLEMMERLRNSIQATRGDVSDIRLEFREPLIDE